jgi:(2Fe-2S) ferredoxin/SAM-dependent methyltransferase
MQPFRYHVIVCTQQKPDNVTCCMASQAGAMLEALKGELRQQGAADDVIISTSGCMGACEHGPVVVVYPDAVWYGPVKAGDVAELVSSHFKQGKPVERLMVQDLAGLRNEILEHRKDFAAKLAARDKGGVVPDEIKELTQSFMPSRTLLTALELDVFSAVGSGASAAEVASRCNTNPRATEMLLNALTGLGLLQKAGGRYANTPVSARFLSAGSPDNARPALLLNSYLWESWSKLTDCVRQGASVARKAGLQPDTETMVAFGDRNARERAMMVMRAIGNGFKRMLDLGGGSGAYSIAFAKANPELKADVFESPAVLPLAQEYIRRAGLEGRVCLRAGDLRTDRFGQDYDLILLSSVAHIFSPEQAQDLLQRACQALAPKGRLVLQDHILEPDKTSPRGAALFSLNALVNTEAGANYSEPEYAAWMRQAGFAEVKRVRLPGPVTLMIAAK